MPSILCILNLTYDGLLYRNVCVELVIIEFHEKAAMNVMNEKQIFLFVSSSSVMV